MSKLTNLNKVTVFHLVVVIGMIAWTGILFALYLWAADSERQHFIENVKLKAESLAQHTQSLRRWVGGHGGVYVEVDGKIKPNPLLANLPERDIETTSGRKLTLFNSPALLREISTAFERAWGDRVRLAAHRPMNPSNTPDQWETEALNKLEAGAATVEAFVSAGDQNYFRLMYPMINRPKCVKCHHYLKDNPQRIVGGLSVIVDNTPYDKLNKEILNKISAGYLSIWALGLFGLVAFDFKGTRLLRNIELIATHDGLTQLNNRREIERLLNLECERAERYGNPFSVMMLDIDHFKRINDTYGHQVGDDALRVVAETTRKTIRKTDIAGRYGGEELLVLAPGDTSNERAEILAQRLNKAIKAAPIELKNGKTISVTVSIGVSSFTPERKSAAALIKSADEALYQAKETGRDRVCINK